jgi:hypothetical protein
VRRAERLDAGERAGEDLLAFEPDVFEILVVPAEDDAAPSRAVSLPAMLREGDDEHRGLAAAAVSLGKRFKDGALEEGGLRAGMRGPDALPFPAVLIERERREDTVHVAADNLFRGVEQEHRSRLR